MKRGSIIVAVFLWLEALSFGLFALPAAAADSCNSSNYVVLRVSTILIECGNNMTGFNGSGTVALQTNLSAATALRITHSRKDSTFFIATLDPRPTDIVQRLDAKTKYQLSLTLTKTDAATGMITTSQSSITVDTTPTISIGPAFDGNPRHFEMTSHLAFTDKDGNPFFEEPDKIRFSLIVTDYSGKATSLPAARFRLSPVTSLDLLDPALVGGLTVELDSSIDLPTLIPADPPDLRNLFGTFKIDPKSRLVAQKAPATKDASNYYFLFSDAAGVGTGPAWVLDAKVAPPVGRLYHGYQFVPIALANVGQGTIKGQTNTNTIDLGASFQKVILPGDKADAKRLLQELFFAGGATYETDKQFDRDNLFAVLGLRYNLRNLYAPQSVRTLRNYYAQKAIAKANNIDLQPEDLRTALWGYVLDFNTGLEAGGSLVDTTVTASSGKATQVLPTYSIVRIVPQAHALIQFWRLSIDGTVIPRYLTETEFTVLQLKNNSLVLKKVSGWNALGVITGSLNLDPLGHFGLTVAYKDGFAPPTFTRVNAVQIGLSAKW